MNRTLFSKKFITVLAFGALALAACGNSEGGAEQVEFLYTGNTSTLRAFKLAADKYSETQGKEDNIKILPSFVATDGLDTKLGNVLISDKGPDVVVVEDTLFKKHSKNLEDLTGLIDSPKLSDMYDNQLYRYHYNTSTGAVSNNEPMYGVPAFNDTTVMYYNKTALEARGIKCISVEENELAAFNAGGTDHNGKTKADYGITINVPAKGFYREKPYQGNGRTYFKDLGKNELAIFNDRISCNWDEIEDVAQIMTEAINSSSTTKYGYYTEWWFNYGWSVGGDCLEDLSGSGDYHFTLASKLPNYIVTEGHTYTGLYSGTVYQAGETLKVADIIDAKAGDTISDYTNEIDTYYYTVNGERADTPRQDVVDKADEGILNELPSIEDAFHRFCNISAKGGLSICPSPASFTQTNSTSYFVTKGIALLIEKISNLDNLQGLSFDYGVARMPIYKEYTDPTDPACDTVKVQGKIASHSLGYCFSIRKNSKMKNSAVKFINWMISEGQKVFAEEGLASGRKSDRDLMMQNMKSKLGCNNPEAVADSLIGAKAGDWWYMPDRNWIDIWANPLNYQVRYGTLSYDAYLYKYIKDSNLALANYKNLLN